MYFVESETTVTVEHQVEDLIAKRHAGTYVTLEHRHAEGFQPSLGHRKVGYIILDGGRTPREGCEGSEQLTSAGGHIKDIDGSRDRRLGEGGDRKSTRLNSSH